jgi:hypothetical protein
MSLSNNALKAIASTGVASAYQELAQAINNGSATAAQSGATVAALIIATSTSTTTDFGALAVGDKVVHIAAVAGNAIFWTVATAGTLPAAAVVGDLYIVLRPLTLPAAAAAVAAF